MKILGGYTYILTNSASKVLYVGVTSDLIKRIYEHKHHVVPGFTARYNINKLVWYEHYDTIENAILREKQIKGGSRRKKIELVTKNNPNWQDIYDQIASS